MAAIPCCTRINCPPGFGQVPGDLEFDAPLANFSSEAPDVDLFIGFNFGWDLNLPNLGWHWNDPNWPGFCDSPKSQADADLCAAQRQLQNTVQGGEIRNDPWLTPTGTPVQLFPNQDQSCSFTCPDGLLFTWTVAAGAVLQYSVARANQIAFSVACQNANAHFMCLPNLPNGCNGQAYSQTLNITSGPLVTTPLTMTIVGGSLPTGLFFSQNQTHGFITGTPTVAGLFPFTLRVTDANGNFMQKVYNLQILGITNLGSLSHPIAGRPYTAQLVAAGGTAPFTFTAPNGGLPTGLSMDTTGLITGTPSVHYSGKFQVDFKVVDATGATCTQTWHSQVDEPPGPDWTQLVWDLYTLNQSPPTDTVSGSAAGPAASGTLHKSNGNFHPEITPAHAGGLSYTGGQVNGQIMRVITTASGGVENAVSRVLVNGVPLVLTPAGGNPTFPAPGTYLFNFTVPASVAAAITIDDASPGNVFAGIAQNGVPGDYAFTWLIYNL